MSKGTFDTNAVALGAGDRQLFSVHSIAIAKKCYRTAGLPLDNLTFQLLVNVYMNEFDQFIKHKLKVKRYIRYADDFVILHKDKKQLITNIRYIVCYLKEQLKPEVHPDKVFIKTLSSGVDFLDWVHFSDA